MYIHFFYKLIFVILTVLFFLFPFLSENPSRQRFKPAVFTVLSGIYTPLYIFLNFPVSMCFFYFLGAL